MLVNEQHQHKDVCFMVQLVVLLDLLHKFQLDSMISYVIWNNV